jgi:predicted RNA-binding protein with PUA-like domain
LLIVFGAAERAKAEAIHDSLSASTQNKYNEATIYHDGKWVLLTINSEEVMADVMRLLEIKRKPKKSGVT